jgi:8-amino-7-oxononanoate synthase
MIDFASALYLGMRHASGSLRSWERISAGVPAALDPAEGAEAIAAGVADLQGCEAATMGTSTLHLVWDLFRLDGASRSSIYLDTGAYPILRWGVERAAARGVVVRSFRHHDADELAQLLRQDRGSGLRPLVITDGLCPSCGRVAPLREYLESAERYGGALVVDDTQALGILGHSADTRAPYGKGGGGSLRWLSLVSSHLVALCSMAKGFGVPAAFISGSRQMVEKFEATSETRVHCSPPSVAVLRAAERALQLNHQHGEQLRAKLAFLVARFRRGLSAIDLIPDGGLFPVQTLATLSGAATLALHAHLLDRGIRTVLHRGRRENGPRLSFLMNADHQVEQVDHAVTVIADKCRNSVTEGAARKVSCCPCGGI